MGIRQRGNCYLIDSQTLERTLLIAVGDRKSLATCGDDQNFDNFCGDVRILHDFLGEIMKNPTTSTGELKPGRLQMEKQELESSFCWEITLWGECLSCWRNQEFGLYTNLLGIPALLFEENSVGDREFRNLALMEILKLNSAGDM